MNHAVFFEEQGAFVTRHSLKTNNILDLPKSNGIC